MTSISAAAVTRRPPSLVRRSIRRTFFIGVLCCAAPLVALYRIAAILIGAEPALQCGSHFVALFPGVPGNYLRLGYYAHHHPPLLPRVHGFLWYHFFDASNCEIGRHVFIGGYYVISDSMIEDDAFIGSRVHVVGDKHVHNSNSFGIAFFNEDSDGVRIISHMSAGRVIQGITALTQA